MILYKYPLLFIDIFLVEYECMMRKSAGMSYNDE